MAEESSCKYSEFDRAFLSEAELVEIKDYDDLREGDRFLVYNELWEVVDYDGDLGVWTNACKCFSPSLCDELIRAGVPVYRKEEKDK